MNDNMSEPRSHIFLIGYMASGKTTFGRALAAAMGRHFVDLDDYIVVKTGMSVSEIFADKGETGFREMEHAALAELIARHDKDLVVACGGGTPCFGDNMDIMCCSGLTVWLDAPIATLLRRLREDRAGRPLVAKLDGGGELERYVAENLERRNPHYNRAQMRFDSSRLESEPEIAESVENFMKELKAHSVK